MTASLRPMGLGEILDRTFQMYRSQFLVFLGIAVLPLSVQMALYLIGFPFEGLVRQTTLPVTLQREIIDSYGWIATRFSSYFLAWVMWPVFCVVTGQILFGSRCNLKIALEECRSRWRGLLGMATLFWILGSLVPIWIHTTMRRSRGVMPIWVSAIVSMFEGFVLIAPLLLSVPVWSIEKRKPADSIARSWTLTRGTYGRMFIAFVLNSVINWSIGLSAGALLSWAVFLAARDEWLNLVRSSWMLLPGYLASVFTAPLIPIAITLFYYDQRVRLEGFDIEWMMNAAGMNAPTATKTVTEEVAVAPGEEIRG